MKIVVFLGRSVLCATVVLMALSCSTSTFRSLSDVPSAEVLGTVQTTFSAVGGHNLVPITERIRQQAHIALREAASQRYSGNIDVVDITVSLIRWNRIGWGGSIDISHGAQYSAIGTVVLLEAGAARGRIGVDGALERAVSAISRNFTPIPPRSEDFWRASRILIVYVTAEDRAIEDFIAGELEHILEARGFSVVERAQLLDVALGEIAFGMTGYVTDATAASIGQLAGANTIITGRVDGEGNLRRLRLRAIDVETGRVIGTASERM